MAAAEHHRTHDHTTFFKNTGGPRGVGDPDDQSLRKVEKDIMIPKLMKKYANIRCSEYGQAFQACGKREGLLLPFKCRQENRDLTGCLERWYKDPDFVHECSEQYLRERSEFRRSGITHVNPIRGGDKS